MNDFKPEFSFWNELKKLKQSFTNKLKSGWKACNPTSYTDLNQYKIQMVFALNHVKNSIPVDFPHPS